MNAQYGQMYSPFRGDVQSRYGLGQQMASQYGQGYGLQAISPVSQAGYQNAMMNFMQPRGIQGLPVSQPYQMNRPANFNYKPQATVLDRPVATKASAAKEAAEERARQEAEAALYQESNNSEYNWG